MAPPQWLAGFGRGHSWLWLPLLCDARRGLQLAHAWAEAQGEWGALCRSQLQSPIDIEPMNVVRGDTQVQTEVRLRYGSIRERDVESVTRQDEAGPTRIKFKSSMDLGYIQVGTSFTNYDEYALTALEVHTPSEHTFRHASWPVEIQFWHEPVSTLRIPELAGKVQGLANRCEAAGKQVSTIVDMSAQLHKEMLGENTPWQQTSVRQEDRVQAEDWIDATKKSIIEEAAKFKAEAAEQLVASMSVIRETQKLVDAQKRELAADKVVISLFILRTPFQAEPTSPMTDNEVPTGSQLLRWVSYILSGRGEASSLSIGDVLGLSEPESHRNLYAYHGSLTRPPCTPNVRWLVAEQPLPALVADIERFLEFASSGISPIDVILSGRDTQPLGPLRRLHSAHLKTELFERPALALEEAPPGSQKWAFLTRYGKVFFLCATMLFITPIVFSLARSCLANWEDDKDDCGHRKLFPDESASELPPATRWRGLMGGAQSSDSTSWSVNVGRTGTTHCDAAARRVLDREPARPIAMRRQSGYSTAIGDAAFLHVNSQ